MKILIKKVIFRNWGAARSNYVLCAVEDKGKWVPSHDVRLLLAKALGAPLTSKIYRFLPLSKLERIT